MPGRHSKKTHEASPTKRKRKRKIILFSGLAVVLLGGGGGYYALTRPLSSTLQGGVLNGTSYVKPPKTTEEASRTNILLMGTDTRPGEDGGNSDVLMLCSIDRKNKRIELLSIPRDTRVMFPDGSYSKINEGLLLGGPALTENLVYSLTNEPIDNYALTHFGGLVDIINTIGGVTINVDKNMYYNTGDKQYGIINLHKGEQTLNGEQALGYVRYRHDALGDIGRTERQQAFLTALTQKLLQPENVTKLPTLVNQFWGTIDTDMSLLDVAGMATKANEYEGYNIISMTLPGSFHDPSANVPHDASYWIVNPLQAQYVAKQFFEDGVVVDNPVQDPNKTENWQPPADNSTQNSTTDNSTGNGDGSTPASSGNGDGSTPASSGTSGDNPSTDPSNSGNTDSGQSGTPQEMVATGNAYIRSGPGQQYSVVGSTTKGQDIWVLGKTDGWYEVQISEGKTGYMADWLLSASH